MRYALNETCGRSLDRYIAGLGMAISAIILAGPLAAGAEPVPGSELVPAPADSHQTEPVLAQAADTAALPGAPTIHAIRIECAGVFEGAEHSSILFRAADAIHMTTRSDFVSRELLFAVGDSLKPSLLRETERNLRNYGAIRSATIQTEPVGADAVDILVSTQDAWTTIIGFSASRTGGRLRLGASGQEINLLGSSKDIGIAVHSGPERHTTELEYGDPHLLGSQVTLDLFDGENSDGYRRRVATARPFRSLETLWAASASYEQSKSDIRLYDGGTESALFRENTQNLALEGGRLVSDPGADRVVRLFGGYRLEDFSYDDRTAGTDTVSSTVETDIPADRRFGFLLSRLEVERHNFIVERNVDRMSRDEDFDVGTRFAVELGVSPRVFGAETGMTGNLGLSRGARLMNGFIFGSASARSRYRNGRGENAIASGQLTAVFKPRERPITGSHTVVAHALYSAGWNLDAVTQLSADGSSGLRGYDLHAFTGDRRLILNLEDRVILTPEIWHLVQIGGAAFADAGYAWPPGEPLAIGDLRSDIGVGLRLGMTRSAVHDLWRIDASYALRPDLLGRQGWLISFASYQAF